MIAMNFLGLLGNYSEVITNAPFSFKWELLIGAAILLIAAFIVLYVLKNVIANAIVGIIAFLIIKYLFGVPIPITGLTILVTVLGGLGGVAALLIAVFLGWL